ncbi:ArsR/SmtB family transcription factor [Yinghuangia soli]|uniref:Helix-turn-helix domain-containing protein n=1 Tax=Yinghuangia soli TaxID=2908204 RepID=A0AA41Q7J3_9ACTN|nr:helix-turn-helix domain-containing protein [Yinghuangia soli]MCF2532370.1 helix-turn-helix domain-containing protein [Yinghuangia soli]
MALFHPTPEQFAIENVLTALGNPTRLAVVRDLSDDGEHPCGSLVRGVAKSTMTHHWRVLREAGVIRQDPSGREVMLTLRRKELDARFPGLLDAVLLAAAEAADACAEAQAAAAAETAAVLPVAAPA